MRSEETLEKFRPAVPGAVRKIFERQLSGPDASGPDADVSELEDFYGVGFSFLQDPKTKTWYLAHWEHETDWTPPSVYIRNSGQISASIEDMKERVEIGRREVEQQRTLYEAAQEGYVKYRQPSFQGGFLSPDFASEALRQEWEDLPRDEQHQRARETVLDAYENALMAINEASRSGKNPLDVLRKSGNRGLEAPAP